LGEDKIGHNILTAPHPRSTSSRSPIFLKLSTRGHYSVKALLDLSLQPDYGPSSVRSIAQRQSIPAPYLEKLLIAMRRAGLVDSLRGVQGGYQLAKPPSQILVGEILAAVGEAVQPISNAEREGAADWVMMLLWQRIQSKMQAAINSISLADLYYDARSWQASQGTEGNYTV
jgi:Rrf2 family transcriptional regulator, iron-sulfur cluster assembly transcription factor